MAMFHLFKSELVLMYSEIKSVKLLLALSKPSFLVQVFTFTIKEHPFQISDQGF